MKTIRAVSEEIRSGRLSPVDVLESCWQHIDQLENRLQAWAFLDRARAQADAERLTVELRQGQYRGPLHGIPLGIKDIIDVFDWPTAAGSLLWKNSLARQDAPVVQRLRQAGAVLLGKTVTTPYAGFDPPPTRNPWNPERTPGGSSSGSAVAVATGMCLGALGSQTGGSITRPASYCGILGCKPTFGRVSLEGVVPLAPFLDHMGVLAGCVYDLALLLQTIAVPEEGAARDAWNQVPDYATALGNPLRPPRLAWLKGLFEDRAEPVVRSMMAEVVNLLRRRQAQVEEVSLPPSFAAVESCHRIIMAVEAARFHGERLRRHPHDYGPKMTALLEEGLACAAVDYVRAREHQQELKADLEPYVKGYDALLCPATTGPAPGLQTTGNPVFNSPWSYTGLPTVSLPAGLAPDGMPLAIQLVGPWCQEKNLFQVAGWFEEKLAGQFPCAPPGSTLDP